MGEVGLAPRAEPGRTRELLADMTVTRESDGGDEGSRPTYLLEKDAANVTDMRREMQRQGPHGWGEGSVAVPQEKTDKWRLCTD